jgi:hypothetical protein
MRQASEWRDDTGKIRKEYARAPKKTPPWLFASGLGVSLDGVIRPSHPDFRPIIEVQLQLESYGDYESLEAFKQREANARTALLSTASRWAKRSLQDTQAQALILHEGSNVSWYDVDIGPLRWATVSDLINLEQGQPWSYQVIEALAADADKEGYEDRAAYIRGFKGKKLWLLSEAQFDSAQFPPPILWGPPFVSGVTVEELAWRQR